MQMERCGAGIVPGSGQWAANAASARADLARFTTMNHQMQSILCLLWWTRSSPYPAGGSSDIRPRGLLRKIGRTSNPHTGSATRKKAIKLLKTAKNRQKSCESRRFQMETGEVGEVPHPCPWRPPVPSAPIYTRGKIHRRYAWKSRQPDTEPGPCMCTTAAGVLPAAAPNMRSISSAKRASPENEPTVNGKPSSTRPAQTGLFHREGTTGTGT